MRPIAFSRLSVAAALALAAATLIASAALADPPRGHDRHDRHARGHGKGAVVAHDYRRRWRPVIVERPVVVVTPGRFYRYRNVVVVRRFGPHYRGYGRHLNDAAAWRWLALTALTVRGSSRLNEVQLRALETAQIRAADVPVGERIDWNAPGARGSVVALRDGVSTTGRYCREFRQTVTIGGRAEQAFGTACRQPDGAWQVVDTGP